MLRGVVGATVHTRPGSLREVYIVMFHTCNFVVQLASVTLRVAQPFNSRATHVPDRPVLYSVQLCREIMLRDKIARQNCRFDVGRNPSKFRFKVLFRFFI